ncbi:putative inorganic diphosphatase [Helianthus anomalus]
MYGIAVAAHGMSSTITTGLAIHAYGPRSDNAGGIAEMAGMSHRIRERTDALDTAGNTTAAIGKVALVPGDAFGDDKGSHMRHPSPTYKPLLTESKKLSSPSRLLQIS